jgi:AcrR family transcriptional regulator
MGEQVATKRETRSVRERRGPGRPRSQPIAEQRARILEAAREVFAEHGFAGTSIERVAKHAGVARPLVYELYGDKESLYSAVVDDAVAGILEWYASNIELAAAQSLRKRIRTAVSAYFGFIVAHPERAAIIRAVSRGGSGSAVRDVRIGRQQLEEGLSDLIREGWKEYGGIPHEAARVLALICLSAVEAVGNRQMDEAAWPMDETVDLLTELLFGGFARITEAVIELDRFE